MKACIILQTALFGSESKMGKTWVKPVEPRCIFFLPIPETLITVAKNAESFKLLYKYIRSCLLSYICYVILKYCCWEGISQVDIIWIDLLLKALK